jgi:hypothetical protein
MAGQVDSRLRAAPPDRERGLAAFDGGPGTGRTAECRAIGFNSPAAGRVRHGELGRRRPRVNLLGDAKCLHPCELSYSTIQKTYAPLKADGLIITTAWGTWRAFRAEACRRVVVSCASLIRVAPLTDVAANAMNTAKRIMAAPALRAGTSAQSQSRLARLASPNACSTGFACSTRATRLRPCLRPRRDRCQRRSKVDPLAPGRHGVSIQAAATTGTTARLIPARQSCGWH